MSLLSPSPSSPPSSPLSPPPPFPVSSSFFSSSPSSSSTTTTSTPSSPSSPVTLLPTLENICEDVLINQLKQKKPIEDYIILYSKIRDIASLHKIRKLCREVIRDKFSFIIERYNAEELLDLIGQELFNQLQEELNERLKVSNFYNAMRTGVVLEREVIDYADNGSGFYPLEALLTGKQWPANVNPSAREQFLSPEDFLKVFNMTKEEFNNEAKFVRLRMKKDVGLF